ncbi:hypothetical protein [Denitratimonas tolerans]|uniref:Uncharacterized protein n=1 Tax=Denitratimonas tolerans TaxID=1338420 RepID=A0AAW9RB38_9GAMM
MTDTARIPRHLQVLGEVWDEFAKRLDAGIAPVMPIVTDHLERTQGKRFSQLATRETDYMQAWIERVTAWVNGPMAQALMNSGTSDRDMRRVAERFSHFADELIERREGLKATATVPSMRAAAPRLDAVYVSILKQVQAFVSQVVAALGPAALSHPNGKREGNSIELSFTFRPVIDAEMAQFSAWMARAKSGWDVASPYGYRRAASLPLAASKAKPSVAAATAQTSPVLWQLGIGTVFALVILVPILIWGTKAIVIMLAIAALIWCIFHPKTVLIVLGLFFFFGPD